MYILLYDTLKNKLLTYFYLLVIAKNKNIKKTPRTEEISQPVHRCESEENQQCGFRSGLTQRPVQL